MTQTQNQEIQEKASNMIITDAPIKVSKDPNYGRTPTLYPEKLLCKQMRSIFITIPKSYQNKQELHDSLRQSKPLCYLLLSQEQHKDETPHFHILAQFNKSVKLSSVHNKILKVEGNIGGSINYQQVRDANASYNYIIKEDTQFLEFGKIRQSKVKNYDNDSQNITIANLLNNTDMNIQEKLEYVKENQPLLYVKEKHKIKAVLEEENSAPKWKAPSMNPKDIKLKEYQQQIWDIVNTPPKARRIIWVYGKPNQGKSFMYNYLEHNYKYKVYNAGQSASLDNVAYGYNEEGLIIWDIPKSYNWENQELVNALASVIEKFSDFGTIITSKKYQGKKTQVLGHALVFSNHPPPKELEHRDILTIIAGEKEVQFDKENYIIQDDTPYNGNYDY